MTGPAIALLVFSMILVWGGLVASILFLWARPEVTDLVDIDAEPVVDDSARKQPPQPSRDT